MPDDIRPTGSKVPADQNKNFLEVQQEPIYRKVDPTPDVLPQTNVAKEQDGFVVLPNGTAVSGKNPFGKISEFFHHLSKPQRIILLTVAVLILIGAGGGVYAMKFQNKPVAETKAVVAVEEKPVEPPKPTTEASRLTGVQIAPEVNKRVVTSIQIENSPDARPQSGLKDAGVIYEAIAEGGITRFNASFLEAQPDYIGPVRSVRPYYAVLAAPFDPVFVHAGGSADGLAAIRNLGLKDMDHGANGAAFRRVPDRYAPHNLYTSTADLDKASAGRGYTTSDVKSFLRKEEKKGQPATANQINLTISSPLYNVQYNYDPATNTYKRTLGGKPHTDLRSGEQLAPKTVIAMSAGYSQNGIYSVYQVIGSGAVSIFQDGQVQQGTWTKASEKEQIVFKDAAGQPIGLNPGQSWITLIKNPGQVTYTP